jgi:hypothetical protein
MKHTMILPVFMAAFSLLITSCGSSTPQATLTSVETSLPAEPEQDVIPTILPTNTPAPALPQITETVPPTTDTFQDPTYGFTFDYPIGWVLDSLSFGSRAPAGYQLTSWDHEPGLVSEVPQGESILNIAVQLWDPRNDLNAFVENRMLAWEASGLPSPMAAQPGFSSQPFPMAARVIFCSPPWQRTTWSSPEMETWS